jgi:hypothetical protein
MLFVLTVCWQSPVIYHPSLCRLKNDSECQIVIVCYISIHLFAINLNPDVRLVKSYRDGTPAPSLNLNVAMSNL